MKQQNPNAKGELIILHPSNSSTSDTPQAQARTWLAYFYSGDISQEKREQFVQWLNHKNENRQAFKHSHQVWQTIGMTDSAVDWLQNHADEEQDRSNKNFFTKSAMYISAMASCVALIAIFTLFRNTAPTIIATPEVAFNSPIGENSSFTLDDGSKVTLSGGSSILVAINQEERKVKLEQGSAYFDVAHDPSRVFSVTAQQTQVRVRGTAFEVKQGTNNAIKVSVERGLVDVADLPEQGTKDEQVQRLTAHQQIRANIHGEFTSAVSPFDPEAEFSWLNERLIYDNVPLQSVIMDINRYASKPVVILNDSINNLPITASFTFKQIDQMLAGLAAAYSITFIEEENRNVLTK
ncbi:FecR family protein [Colwellia sp. RE-S-Sl-9]